MEIGEELIGNIISISPADNDVEFKVGENCNKL